MNSKDIKLSTLLTAVGAVALVIIFYGPSGPTTYTAETMEQVRSLTRKCSLEEQGQAEIETIWKNMGAAPTHCTNFPAVACTEPHDIQVPIGWSVTCYPLRK